MSRELRTRGELTRPTADPTFVQQGQVDWVSLSGAVSKWTVEIYLRFSGAGVQPATVIQAHQLATRFQLAEIGDQRLYEAVKDLSIARAFANVAYFGFGARSFVHVLFDSKSGANCVALCASLSESHSEELAARIVNSLWKVLEWPEDHQPTLPQSRCLVKACAGVFAKSTFHETMNIMLGPYREFLKKGRIPEASDPLDTARALLGIFDVSKSLRKQITVVGGAECSFIAAISYWLFGMKILVEDSCGTTIFSSTPSTEQPQVHIVYKETDQLLKVVVTKSTFVLGAPTELLRYMADRRLRLVRTRAPWISCLSYTFGQDFMDLMGLETEFGQFLGGAARLYQALARGESDVSCFSRESFIDFVEDSYGRGFRESMVKIFPELSKIEILVQVDSILSQTVSGAVTAINGSMLGFKRHCLCSDCPNSKVTIREGHGDRVRLCSTVLAATVFQLIVILSSVVYEQEMQVTENGLYRKYEQNRKIWHDLEDKVGVQALAKLLGLHQTENARGAKMPSEMMADAICLFTGHEFTRTELETYNYRTAIAENGVCVYLDCLESITTDPEHSRRIHVIPGHIGRGYRTFDSIWDCAPIEAPFLEAVQFHTASDNPNVSASDHSPEQLTMTALFDEPGGPGQLSLYYQISTPQGSVLIQPGAMSTYILSRSGLVVCSRFGCDERFSFYPYFIHRGWNFNNQSFDELSRSGVIPAKRVFVWKHANSTIARLLALEIQRQSSNNSQARTRVLLAQGKCLSCSVRTATQIEFPPVNPHYRLESLIHVL